MRKGEVLGLTWELVDLDAAELYVGEQLQRVGHQLLRREVKTETSEAPVPLPGLCVTALKIRKRQQDADRARAGQAWIETGLVFTTRHGTPIEPWNFNRSFNRCIAAAKVPTMVSPLLHQNQNGRFRETEPAGELGGRYWDRTSDLLGVK